MVVRSQLFYDIGERIIAKVHYSSNFRSLDVKVFSQKMFQLADDNGDKYLDEDDLQQLLKQINISISKNYIRKLI